ncbi:MAG: EAL domain-containing protein, partial [Gammaproteobacteria bacterium]|nr:EAL domain-containing protein [Gammaproteobacteria bacterium]
MNKVKPARNTVEHTFEELNSSLCRTSLYGLAAGILLVLVAASTIGYQMTGEFSLYGMARAHDGHVGLRFLYLMPILLAFWGQHFGERMMSHAGNVIEQKNREFQQAAQLWELKSHHDATHDLLTGLPNRLEFYNRLKETIQQAEREGCKLVLMSLDLDNLKDINNAYGTRCGDLLLVCVASRLTRQLPGSDWVCRTGGDEFTILSMTSSSEDVGIDIATRIRTALEKSFLIEGKQIHLRGSIGIAAYPEHAETADSLLQKAELAMHAAKQSVTGMVEYSADMKTDNTRRVSLLSDLKSAIQDKDLTLYYQPKIDMVNGTVSSAEALLRWRHLEHGFVSPDEFIPLAERNRLINLITRQVIHDAMLKMRSWCDQGRRTGLCLNISPRDLDDPELIDYIEAGLADMDLDPGLFTLEITENSIMKEPKHSLAVIRRLSDLGLKISIDDFGTGYSSLAYLSQLPVDEIK